MGIAALILWLSTAGGGLYLLAVWLIEYDHEFQAAAKTRLPIPVISGHVLLALAGLILWAAYLLSDSPVLAWAALSDLGAVVALGLTMAWRWLRVYRAPQAPPEARPASVGTIAAAGIGIMPRPGAAGAGARPPERNFPVTVVILHGVLALATVLLVAVTAIRGS
jgi:hypothetical protein